MTEAGAVTIDFNDTVASSTYLQPVFPYVEDGFQLMRGTSGAGYFLFDANYTYTRRRDSDYFSWSGGGAKVVLASASLTPFSIQSFEYGNLSSYGPGGTLTITGNLSGGGTISANVTPLHDVQTYFFDPAWTNLSSVVFASADVGSMMDTIVVNEPAVVVNAPVPERGSTIAMLGFVLTAVAGVRRKLGC